MAQAPTRIAVDDEQDELVTGEAVALVLRPTSFVLRAAGCAIDYAVYLALYIAAILTVLDSAGRALDEALIRAVAIALAVFCFVVLPMLVEALSRGRSLGRLAVGARIVRDDGGAIGLRHAFIRSLLGVLEIIGTLGGMAAVVGLLSARTKRLGDLLAGTFSQYERTRNPAPMPFLLPPELAGWAQVADVARLPDPLARRVAHFIRQSGGMNPYSRERLARALAAEVAVYVHPLPPVPADRFLLAVAAMRRDRESTALAREAAQLERLAPVLRAAPHGFPDRG